MSVKATGGVDLAVIPVKTSRAPTRANAKKDTVYKERPLAPRSTVYSHNSQIALGHTTLRLPKQTFHCVLGSWRVVRTAQTTIRDAVYRVRTIIN